MFVCCQSPLHQHNEFFNGGKTDLNVMETFLPKILNENIEKNKKQSNLNTALSFFSLKLYFY
jgi:hypothetical protein